GLFSAVALAGGRARPFRDGALRRRGVVGRAVVFVREGARGRVNRPASPVGGGWSSRRMGGAAIRSGNSCPKRSGYSSHRASRRFSICWPRSLRGGGAAARARLWTACGG